MLLRSSAEELESANRQKKQRIEAQMAMRAGGGPAAAAASSGAGGGGNPAALTTTLSGPMAGLSAGGGAAGAPAATGTGRAAMTEEEEMEAAIRASLEGAGTDGSSEPAQPARIDSPAVAPAELQPEPAQGTANVSAMAFRLPGGERVQRRFAGDRSLQDAFDFLHLEHGLAPGSYSMVRRRPQPALCLQNDISRREEAPSPTCTLELTRARRCLLLGSRSLRGGFRSRACRRSDTRRAALPRSPTRAS